MLDEVTRELLRLDGGRRWVVLEEGQIEGTLYEAAGGGRLRATESRQGAHVSETPWLAFTVGWVASLVCNHRHISSFRRSMGIVLRIMGRTMRL